MNADRIRPRGNICGAVIGSRPQSLFIFSDWALSHERTFITCLYHLQPRPAVIKKPFWKALNQSSSRGKMVVVGVVYICVSCFIGIRITADIVWLLDYTEI